MKMRFIVSFGAVCLTVLSGLLFTTPVVGQVCDDYGQYIHPIATLLEASDYPGFSSYTKVGASGDQIAVTDGSQLKLVDITDPYEPILAARVPLTDDPYSSSDVRGMFEYGDYVYILYYNSMLVVRAQGTNNPRVVGSVPLFGAYSGSFAIRDGYGYLARSDGGVQILDLSSPGSPTVIGSFTGSDNIYQVAVSGSYLLVHGRSGVFEVYDLSVPTAPVLTGGCDLSADYAIGIVVSGNQALVLGNDGYLKTVDFSNPVAPVLVNNLLIDTDVNELVVDGNHAVITTYELTHLLDVSDYSSPQLIGMILAGGSSSEAMFLRDGLGFLTNYDTDLTIVDMSSWELPSFISYSQIPGTDLVAVGDYAYSGYLNYFVVTDISDPALPVVVSTFDVRGTVKDIVIEGSLVYVVDGYYGLQIFDLGSDPANPTALGLAYAPGWPEGIAVSGDWAYVGCEEAGVTVFNVADPMDPYAVDWVAVPEEAEGMAVGGGYLYVADAYGGLLVFDISDPYALDLVGLTGVPGYSNTIALNGNYAYVGGYSGGFWTVDVSNPSRPDIVGHSTFPDEVRNISMHGRYAYVASGSDGGAIVDISIPSSPRVVGSLPGVGSIRDVAIAGNTALVMSEYGLTISAVQCGWDGSGTGTPEPLVMATLAQNYPNPFNPLTTIRYELGSAQPVSLRIFDVGGRLVRTLAKAEVKSAGLHEVTWRGRDDSGRQAAAGVYLYELITPEIRETRRMTLLK